ncbi:MAG: CDP-diacylglycerol--glycerol-3-phosphate 3-phosphatidyltransferase [Tissierellia bacterium]|nr:CDP-diacylglycerol--glycerol-3-phosphate 3-phosphatidyltransferase [Tissierellia bacterium]
MNIANKITIFRIFLVPVFLILMYMEGEAYQIAGGLVFILASMTDWIDGYLARSRKLVTTFGKFMDPLADKVLTSAAFIILVEKNIIPAWAVIIIIARELLITGFRTLASSKNITIAASPLGKLKTVSQLLALIMLLFSMLIPLIYGLGVFYLAVVLTVLSGADYIYTNRKVLDLQNL